MAKSQSRMDAVLDFSASIDASVRRRTLVLEVPERGRYGRVGDLEENGQAVDYIIQSNENATEG